MYTFTYLIPIELDDYRRSVIQQALHQEFAPIFLWIEGQTLHIHFKFEPLDHQLFDIGVALGQLLSMPQP